MEFLNKHKELFISGFFLLTALLAKFLFNSPLAVYLPLYIISYLTVGGSLWIKAFNSIRNGTIFSEFLLMGIATLGAFAIGKYAEGVAVILFYTIGEEVQHGATNRAHHSIEALLNQQPETATIEENGDTKNVHPSEVDTGTIIRVKPGEKVPLDGVVLTDKASFNTAALTGESKPMAKNEGDEIWAGSINQDQPVRIRVTSAYKDTKLSKILAMVRDAAKRKAPTQRFITKFASIYTPVVVWLAVAVTFVPYFFVQDYVFQDWFYRALIFLVVSCPCGLVISIPLGYFGGIGAASRNGILLKGSNFLDQLRNMDTLFLDKTGTLTEGSFEVQDIKTENGYSKKELLQQASSLEQQSSHPIGRAIIDYTNGTSPLPVTDQQEISGRGLKGQIKDQTVLVGNRSLLENEGITVAGNGKNSATTRVFVAVNDEHAGTIYIADRIKSDSKKTISQLKDRGLNKLVMLSGDNQSVTNAVANELGVDEAYGGLLPDEKYERVEQAISDGSTVGFVGDGVNDAPVITLSDVGMAMGGIGSDATIETADVVIQTDQPSKIATALDISHFTHRIVWQNIGFALGIKALVLVLATFGMANMWEAIFADVGVALIAVANAVRVQNHFSKGSYLDIITSSDDTLESNESESCCCD